MNFDHGLPDKHTLHTEALAVPLIISWPSRIRPMAAGSQAAEQKEEEEEEEEEEEVEEEGEDEEEAEQNEASATAEHTSYDEAEEDRTEAEELGGWHHQRRRRYYHKRVASLVDLAPSLLAAAGTIRSPVRSVTCRTSASIRQ